MEYLVTMTTHVPDGTSDEAVQDIRTREAARSGQLATQGHLLRLWRPPLQPGEWRTLGLFAADDGVELEEVLASMPLRVWRTDEVTPLSPHPNDPARQTEKPGTPATRTRRPRVSDHVHRGRSGGHRPRDRRCHHPARSRSGAGARRAGLPGATLDAARPGPRAGPVAGSRLGRDERDPRVAAVVPLDERADHAAHPPPQ